MPDRVWLDKVINTAGIYCPLYGASCPGSRAKGKGKGCAFWLPLTIQNEKGQADTAEGCSFLWELVQRNEVLLETVRSIATSDKLATEVHGVAQAIRVAAAVAGSGGRGRRAVAATPPRPALED